MNLYVLRHGEAGEREDPRYPDDADRPLTPKGIRRTRALLRILRQQELRFDAICSSPFVRARKTAEIIERGLRLKGRLELTDELAPEGDVARFLRRLAALRPVPGNVLLVGHEPDLSGLISLLCTGGDQLSLTLKKGGLCRLQIDTLRAGRCARLEWLLAPSLLPRRARE
jgi:phosphohistidine phosphatase